ncbi:hypothetical protein VTI74DRAFT_8647 [Chaetomium olivicolor]
MFARIMPLRALRQALAQRPVLARLPRVRTMAQVSKGSSSETPIEATHEQWPRRIPDARLLAGGLKLWPEWQSVQRARQHRSLLPYFWLRDNCRCTRCVNQDTMQRNFNTFEVPNDICPEKIVRIDKEGVTLQWPDHDGQTSHYNWDFLRFYMSADARTDLDDHVHFGAEVAANPPTVGYKEVMETEAGVAELTRKIMKQGFVFVEGTPYDDPDKTRQLLERIAFIRVTHYGGFYDFIPDLAMADTAYTNLALPAHTDTTYFTDPAGLQAFHMLSHQPAPGADPGATVSGGQSLLVDGFKAAAILQEEDFFAFRELARIRLPFHASGNKGITITPYKMFPVLELKSANQVARIRWNNDDRGVVPFGSKFNPSDWYKAARKFDSILRRKEMEYWFQLEPGKVLIFDNWRVLHGRAAFTGIRRICGGYINRDDFVSRYRNTNFTPEEVRDRVVG